jgi:hypothetical protein
MTPTILRSLISIILTAPLLGGCARPHTDFAAGGYKAERGTRLGDVQSMIWMPAATLTMDLDAMTATFESGGAQLVLAVDDQGKLDDGACNDEVTGEWALLTGGALVIDGVTFEKPMIFAECASMPVRVILAERGGMPLTEPPETEKQLWFRSTIPYGPGAGP